jgi:calcineurin-like phosphoesterase family protein
MLNLIQNSSQRVFFVSDTHFGHKQEFVWGSRGYSSVEEHDLQIIESINQRVRENDILLHLGDFCLNTTIEKFHEYIQSIKCQNVWMLFGNHNNPHERKVYQPLTTQYIADASNRKFQVYPVVHKNIKFLGHYYEVSVDGQVIVMFHYPISVWNFMSHGAWHLCGHSHYNFDPSTAENKTSKILDVGWDGQKKPYSFEEVKAIMDTKGIAQIDHHV